jgi:hypothetical protein
LLGIAPVIPARSEPPAATAPEPEPEPAPEPPPAPAATPLVAPTSDNPLRKQTLLGIAPVIAAQPKPAEAASPVEPASSVPSILTPPVAIATDAPTTSDVPAPAPVAKTEPRRPEAARPAAALSISHDDLPELKPARSRAWWALGAAAVIALGVVGLRQLDRAPTPVPAELARPVGAAKPVSPATDAVPKSDDDDDDDDDGNVPNTGTDTQPDPIPPEPEPLKAKTDDAKASAAAPSAPAASAAPAVAAPAGSIVRINISSDPPGARLFWRGKEQGTTPFVLEFPAGERHSYELGLPGYTVRKVVIDGSKTDISIGMRPDPSANSGASPRK